MFSKARTLFRVSGLVIRVDPSWLLIATLITWSLAQHVFPAALPGLDRGVYVVMGVVAMLLFFASLLLHEMAHAVTGRQFGIETRSITLFLFGGVAELEEEPARAADEFRIALAGPAMSLCLAGLFQIAGWIGQAAGLPAVPLEILFYLALINLVLALFNLLPAFPLDGGRVLRAWLWRQKGDVLAATQAAARVGAVLAYGLMALGALFLFQGGLVTGIWEILLGVFILAAGRNSADTRQLAAALNSKVAADLMTPAPVVAPPDATLSELVNQVMLPHRVSFVPVMEDGVLLGHIDTSILAGMDREHWASTHVGDIYADLTDSAVVSPAATVRELMARVAETGQRKFMVVEAGDLVGIVTLADLARHMVPPGGDWTDRGRARVPEADGLRLQARFAPSRGSGRLSTSQAKQ